MGQINSVVPPGKESLYYGSIQKWYESFEGLKLKVGKEKQSSFKTVSDEVVYKMAGPNPVVLKLCEHSNQQTVVEENNFFIFLVKNNNCLKSMINNVVKQKQCKQETSNFVRNLREFMARSQQRLMRRDRSGNTVMFKTASGSNQIVGIQQSYGSKSKTKTGDFVIVKSKDKKPEMLRPQANEIGALLDFVDNYFVLQTMVKNINGESQVDPNESLHEGEYGSQSNKAWAAKTPPTAEPTRQSSERSSIYSPRPPVYNQPQKTPRSSQKRTLSTPRNTSHEECKNRLKDKETEIEALKDQHQKEIDRKDAEIQTANEHCKILEFKFNKLASERTNEHKQVTVDQEEEIKRITKEYDQKIREIRTKNEEQQQNLIKIGKVEIEKVKNEAKQIRSEFKEKEREFQESSQTARDESEKLRRKLSDKEKATKEEKQRKEDEEKSWVQHIQQLQDELHDVTQERDRLKISVQEYRQKMCDVTSRLASEMNEKVSANESSLENISIQCRPINVAEEYQLLGSNTWLDAKQALDELKVENEAGIKFLCDVLMMSEKVAQEFFTQSMWFLRNPEIVAECSNHQNQKPKAVNWSELLPVNVITSVGDHFRRHSENMAIEPFASKINEQIENSGMKWIPKALCKSRIHTYINESARLTWKMVIQRPPMWFSQEEIRQKFKGEKEHPLAWGSKPSKKAVVHYYLYPTLMHGDKSMVIGKVFVK